MSVCPSVACSVAGIDQSSHTDTDLLIVCMVGDAYSKVYVLYIIRIIIHCVVAEKGLGVMEAVER